MITMTLGWGAVAALVGWSGLMFALGRISASGPGGHDLTGPPATLSSVPPPPRPPSAAALRPPAALTPETLAEIRDEIARGNKINAIKLMREATGLGLAESKQAVEAMES